MIIDAHSHIGYSPQFYFPDVSIKTMLRVMDSLEIEKSICSHLSLLYGDRDFGFRESIESYRKSEKRILLYTVFNPNIEGSIDFVKECLQREEFVGIKVHPSGHQCYADDERYEPVWELAAEKKVPLLTHTWDISDYNPAQKYSFPALFEKFIRKYREAKAILGHAGGRYNGHIVAAKLARQYDNVYLDLSGDSYSLGLIEYLANTAGSEKILFGSDVTWIDPRTHIGRILDAEISLTDKEKILRLNAREVFKL